MKAPETESPKTIVDGQEQKVVQDVLRALQGLRYGSVILTVHDGRLVEIQKTEKFRVNAPRQEI